MEGSKMKALFAVLVSITILSSEMATGQDVKMISDLASYGLEVAQVCAKENSVSLVKIMGSLLLSRTTADKNCKCAIACILESFYLLIDGKVETDMIAQIIDAIPTESLKTQAVDLINKCGKKGKGPDKCENAYAFALCLKQNGAVTVVKTMLG